MIKLDSISEREKNLVPSKFLSKNLKNAVSEFEYAFINRVIEECGNNKEEAARRLQIDASTLYRKLDKLNIE